MNKKEHVTPIGNEGIYMLDTGSWRNFRPIINKEACTNCGMCFTYCPVNSIYKQDEEFVINLDYCKGCGICSSECPTKAIDMICEGGGE